MVDILTASDLSTCPNSCIRPVGLALDSKERLFISSDSTGEIYVLMKTSVGEAGTPTSSSTPTATKTGAAMKVLKHKGSAALVFALIMYLI